MGAWSVSSPRLSPILITKNYQKLRHTTVSPIFTKTYHHTSPLHLNKKTKKKLPTPPRHHSLPHINNQHTARHHRAKAALEQMKAAGLISLPTEGAEGAEGEKRRRPVYGKKKGKGGGGKQQQQQEPQQPQEQEEEAAAAPEQQPPQQQAEEQEEEQGGGGGGGGWEDAVPDDWETGATVVVDALAVRASLLVDGWVDGWMGEGWMMVVVVVDALAVRASLLVDGWMDGWMGVVEIGWVVVAG